MTRRSVDAIRAALLTRTALVSFLVSILLGAWPGAPALGQTTTGRLSGLITDSSGHIVPRVTIVIVREANGSRRTTMSDEGGFYIVTDLPPGSYAVDVRVPGFKPVTQTGTIVAAGGRVTVDIRLEPGPMTDAIVVSAHAGEVANVTSGEIARVVDRRQVDSLALAARNAVQLFSIVPGAPLIALDPIAQTIGGTVTQPINGNRGDSNNLMVDGGFNLAQANLTDVTSAVGLDFIQEVTFQTSSFSAEYGRQLGAAINIVTRGGTNEWAGSLFGIGRHEALDARHAFAARQDRLRLADAAWTLGGPVRRGRLFALAGQEWRHVRRDTAPVRRTLPTRAERRGDFSASSGSLRFPGTSAPVSNRDVSALITPEGRAIASVYDAMEARAVWYVDQPIPNNAVFQPESTFDARQDFLRIDAPATDRHTFSARYLHDAVSLLDPFGTNIDSPLPTTPTIRTRPTHALLASHTWVMTPTVVQETRVNLGWYRANTVPTGDTWQRDVYGFTFPQVFDAGRFDEGLPDVTIAGYTGFRGPSAAIQFDAGDFTINHALTLQRGRHTVRLGALVVHATNRQLARASDLVTGSIAFDPAENPHTTGNAFADALLGNFRTYTEQSATPPVSFALTSVEAFASDTWRVGDRLSLELGARYHRLRPLSAANDAISTFDPARYDPARAVTVLPDGRVVPGSGDPFNGLVRAGDDERAGSDPAWRVVPAGAPRTLWDTAHRVAPRASAAYVLPHAGGLLLRAGAGVFYETVRGDMTQRASANPPFLDVVTFEDGHLARPAAEGTPASGVLGTISAVDPRMRTPSATNYSVSLQRDLPSGVLVDVAYVGNRGRHLTWRPDINRVPFDVLAANAARPPESRASVNALRPYKGYSAIRQYRADARSDYHALQAYAARRRGNAQFTASYTWSKVLTDASAAAFDPEDLDDRAFNYGPATFDRRHVFVGTYTWHVPWLRERGGLIGTLLGGWALSGITRLQSGPYLTVSGNTAIGPRRADQVGESTTLPSGQRTRDRWFDTDAFARAPDWRRGTAGVGTVQGPGLHVWDASLRKMLPAGDRLRLQLQVDVFNLFNHVNLMALDTDVTSASFGSLASAAPARSLQLGVRATF